MASVTSCAFAASLPVRAAPCAAPAGQSTPSTPRAITRLSTDRRTLMAVIVRIPTPLRSLTGGNEEVQVEDAATVSDVIDRLEVKHAGMKDRLLDEKGVRKF